MSECDHDDCSDSGAAAATRPLPGDSGVVHDPIRTEVWAQLILCREDCDRVRDFFTQEIGLKPRFVVKRMHLTVYHARRPMPGLQSLVESAAFLLPAADSRFMVMAPGGENPRPDLDPGDRKVGIRVHRQSAAIPAIRAYREHLIKYETRQVLGNRSPSTHRSNAFGARHFQPHMAMLRAGSGIDRDLTPVGRRFRELIGSLRFDAFQIEVIRP